MCERESIHIVFINKSNTHPTFIRHTHRVLGVLPTSDLAFDIQIIFSKGLPNLEIYKTFDRLGIRDGKEYVKVELNHMLKPSLVILYSAKLKSCGNINTFKTIQTILHIPLS